MTIDQKDRRLEAAILTEQQFVGELVVHGDNDAYGLINVYEAEMQWWSTVPVQKLIKPQKGYKLHYDPGLQSRPLVFLSHEDQLVGVFEGETLTIDSEHRRKGLSREMILAGFAQKPWKDLKNRKVTKAGEAALRSTHRFITEKAGKVW